MTISIALGWWIAPAAATAILYILAFASFEKGGGDYNFSAVYNLFLFVLATLFTIIAWLTWGVLA